MGCKVVRGVVALVLTVTTIASLIGVWNTHMVAGSLSFGSAEGSFAILALVFSVVMWHKISKKMCPCNKGGCAGGACGSGGGCPCGKGADCKCGEGCGCGKGAACDCPPKEHAAKEEKHHHSH